MKKENNKKNYLSRKAFLEHQKENRPKQVWEVVGISPVTNKTIWEPRHLGA